MCPDCLGEVRACDVDWKRQAKRMAHVANKEKARAARAEARVGELEAQLKEKPTTEVLDEGVALEERARAMVAEARVRELEARLSAERTKLGEVQSRESALVVVREKILKMICPGGDYAYHAAFGRACKNILDYIDTLTRARCVGPIELNDRGHPIIDLEPELGCSIGSGTRVTVVIHEPEDLTDGHPMPGGAL